MSDPVNSHAFLNLCEMSIDNMYELEALGEMLEEKGFITKQEIIDRARFLKAQTHQALPSTPEAQPIPNKENVVIEQIMDVILQSDFSAQQAKVLLERTITLLKWEDKTLPNTTH